MSLVNGPGYIVPTSPQSGIGGGANLRYYSQKLWNERLFLQDWVDCPWCHGLLSQEASARRRSKILLPYPSSTSVLSISVSV